jgi:tripartite-type tricarboxylate transporter receptor subunit TctC
MFDPLQSVLSNVVAGRLRPLAISSKARSSVLPDTPTVAESGYSGFETTAWWGVFAPAGLSDPLTAMLAGEIERIVDSEVLRRQLEPLGVVPTALSRVKFSEFQHAELAKWAKAVRDGGVRID